MKKKCIYSKLNGGNYSHSQMNHGHLEQQPILDFWLVPDLHSLPIYYSLDLMARQDSSSPRWRTPDLAHCTFPFNSLQRTQNITFFKAIFYRFETQLTYCWYFLLPKPHNSDPFNPLTKSHCQPFQDCLQFPMPPPISSCLTAVTDIQAPLWW